MRRRRIQQPSTGRTQAIALSPQDMLVGELDLMRSTVHILVCTGLTFRTLVPEITVALPRFRLGFLSVELFK